MSERPFFRRSIAELVPYEPGKPVEEVQRELGLERVVKLASNEGPFGPFPAALDALERAERELNRYPDGGAYALRSALAERYGVGFEQVAIGAGADGVIDCLSQAVLDAGDEIVCGWPSFPSYVIGAIKLGAVPMRVPLRDHRYDLDALLAAITERTKLVYLSDPERALRARGSDIVELNYLALARWTAVPVDRFDTFVQRHDEFRVYAAGAGWQVDQLRDLPATLTLAGAEAGGRLFVVRVR